MAKEKLHEYPILIDASLDFKATKEHFGTGSCNYAISEYAYGNGRVVVYFHQQREGKVFITPIGFKRACEQGIVICGYKANPKGFLKFLKSPKIKTIPDTERQKVESELAEIIKPDYVDFWINSE